jgi:recombination protein RecR
MKRGLEKFNILVEALESLPTIGKKSATRMAYHMVMQDNFTGMKIAHAIENALGCLRKCIDCGGLCEDELCGVCADESRDKSVLCVVENAKDILTIEEGGFFEGRYFVLENLDHFDKSHLVDMVSSGVKEVIFALTPSIANDAVMLFIEDKLSMCDVNFTRIAQGVPTGVSLENIDLLSLGRAIEDRVKV